MTAHQRAHRAADGSIANRFPHVGELGVEPLRVADGEFQLALARQGDELVCFGEFQRNWLLEKYVLACGEAIPRHRVVCVLRRGRNIDRFDLGDGEQLTIIDDRGAGAGRLGHFGQALGTDLRQMQAFHQRIRRAGLRADAAAPARADDADIDLLHSGSSSRSSTDAAGRPLRHAARRESPARSPSLEHRGLRGTNRDLLCWAYCLGMRRDWPARRTLMPRSGERSERLGRTCRFVIVAPERPGKVRAHGTAQHPILRAGRG